MPHRIIIADDHGVLRAGLRLLLEDEPDIDVVGEAADGEELLSLTQELLPDIVLLDIGMPKVDGIEATRQIKTFCPQVSVLVLSVYEDQGILKEAIKAGASGYVIKRAAEEELIEAIRAVRRGDMYIHPAITRLLFTNHSPSIDLQKEGLESLTPREQEIMRYLAIGYTNRLIAEKLTISVRTVESHRASILDKLGLKNRVELVEFLKKGTE